MKTTNRQHQLSVESVSHTDYFTKENPMNRRIINAILTSLLFALFALSAAPVFAQEPTPGTVDAAEQAYLQEYQQRAVEKYQALQAKRTATIAATAIPDWGGEMAIREYDERSRAAYAAIQKGSALALIDGVPDWGGELFLAEYEQRAREIYVTVKKPSIPVVVNSVSR